MNCPECGARLNVTRTTDDGRTVWRERKCTPCGWIYTTKERIVDEITPKEAHKPRDWAAQNARRKTK